MLLQLIADLGEAGAGAGFVLVAAGSAGSRDAADRVLAGLDRQAARSGAELAVELAGIESARRSDPLGVVRGRDSLHCGRVGFAPGDLERQRPRAVADQDELGRAGAI